MGGDLFGLRSQAVRKGEKLTKTRKFGEDCVTILEIYYLFGM